MTTENIDNTLDTGNTEGVDIDAELAALLDADKQVEELLGQSLSDEERLPVLFAVPTGLVQDGQMAFMPTVYNVTTTTMMEVQAMLFGKAANGTGSALTRLQAAIGEVVLDEDLAAKLATHLLEKPW